MPALLALLLQAAPVVPGDPARARPLATILVEPAAMLLAACDADGDGRTTAAERDRCVARLFAAAESQRGGSIGYIAYADWCLRWLGDRNALPSPFEVDADGDNRITAAELGARFRAIFDRLDADRDGVLTRAELVTVRASAPGDGAPPGDRGRGRQRPPR